MVPGLAMNGHDEEDEGCELAFSVPLCATEKVRVAPFGIDATSSEPSCELL